MTLWLRWLSGFNRTREDLTNLPAPAVMAGGIGGSGHGQYTLEDDKLGGDMSDTTIIKPPYRVPTMAEVRAAKCTQLKVATTFAGGGGSSTGYEMAGYQVVWANEFVPAAQETYKANHQTTILDGRDIKSVMAEEILKATGLRRGELDLFDGSPPCQAFSTAGKREKGWGKAKRYEHGAEQCNELLFFEYIRLLKGLQPKAFVAENVRGLTIGKAREMMGDAQLDMLDPQDDTILHGLMDAGYVVRWRVLCASRLGVPQTRNRVIFVGVRKDIQRKHNIDVDSLFPPPLPYVYTVRDALPELCGRGAVGNDAFEPKFGEADVPSPTITANGARTSGLVEEGGIRIMAGDQMGFNKHKLQDVTNKPHPAVTCQGGPPAICIEDVNRFDGHAPKSVDRPAPAVLADRTSLYVDDRRTDPATGASLELDASRQRVCDGQQEFGSAGEAAVPDEPAPPVLTPSNSVVYKPERRKFTIAELKRICAFPDDYVLTGSYSQQWERCGNSVPPVMMRHIAEALRDRLFAKIGKLVWQDRPQPAPEAAPTAPDATQAAKPKAKAKRSKKPEVAEPAKVDPSKPPEPELPDEMDDKWKDYWKGRL